MVSWLSSPLPLVPENTLSNKFIDYLAVKTQLFRVQYQNDTTAKSIARVVLRCLAAFVTLLCSVVDMAWWLGKTIVIIPELRTKIKEHLTNLISHLTLPIIAIAIPCGYLPKIKVLDVPFYLHRELVPEPQVKLTVEEQTQLNTRLVDATSQTYDVPQEVEKLLQSGAQANAEDHLARTALMYAVSRLNSRAVKILLKHKAEVSNKRTTTLSCLLFLPVFSPPDQFTSIGHWLGAGCKTSPSAQNKMAEERIYKIAAELVRYGDQFSENEFDDVEKGARAIRERDRKTLYDLFGYSTGDRWMEGSMKTVTKHQIACRDLMHVHRNSHYWRDFSLYTDKVAFFIETGIRALKAAQQKKREEETRFDIYVEPEIRERTRFPREVTNLVVKYC